MIARLSDKHRVIGCADGLQWIIQHRSAERWRGVSFHRDRDVLIERCGPLSDEAAEILRALPPNFRRWKSGN